MKCTQCDLVYMPEIPSDASLETDYEWDESFARERFERWKKKPLMKLWTALVWTIKPPREKRALRFIRRFATTGRMLDIGCGDGRLALRAKNSGFAPTGIELSEKMAAKARWRIGNENVFCGRLTEFEAANGSFDVAVTVSYMEHEPDPAGVMMRTHALLRSGGICVHKVPNYDSKLRSMLGARWSGYRWPEHFQYYTPATLSRLMTDAGFEIIATRANRYSDNFWVVGQRS
ncbi:MAG: class I SAM-dependent methyltransferase [Phycisphaerae bacterium]